MLPVFLILSNYYINFVTALDTIIVSLLMKDPETVTSNDGTFKPGFFSPGKMSNRYVGICYLRGFERRNREELNRQNRTSGCVRREATAVGYMSPEYAMEGLFSEKSDVFSFGVLLLEIISGRENSSFRNHELLLSLLGYAWQLWNEEEIVSLIDPEIFNPDNVNHILRCIHIGLLCVQELAKETPTMATVVSMLNSEVVNFPPPRQPSFI
ncbi:G-type lectin S-receptor-like serine/threonine-protein kinase At1g11300 [Glycine max]|uniref:G-type lectin S-receptor-like serine/threonine-protein kinase At1g11300 n=2 Tax=Glycine subgen. Soja TaxID=1462606 RepID=UPI0007192EC5|nr:G-type lectin S-receptor-like serine/threonine-protein kinase At1g11300 [Glycine max]